MGQRAGPIAFWTLLAGLLGLRLAAIYTETINWDEFALLARAADTVRTGELYGAGRPGLATLVLMPFVEGCVLATEAVRSARWLWTGFTVALVCGFWVLLRSVLKTTRSSWDAAALGLALLVLVPVFLRWSIQVRTDQPSLALGLWAAVFLLASRRSPVLAGIAGVLFGVGLLFSQKLVYVAALGVVLAAGDVLLRRDARIRRELGRGLLCAGAALGVVLVYDFMASRMWSSPAPVSVAGGLRVFAFYRETLGFSVYVGMLPTLLPHLFLIGLMAGAVFLRKRTPRARRRELILALVVLNLGAAVMLFHAAAFPYFWMTLGLFPAVAVAVAIGPLREVFSGPHMRWVLVGVWAFLVLSTVPAAISLLEDSQRVQRESLSFVESNFEPDQHGFHPERALFCRGDPDPFDTYFTQVIRGRFEGPDGEANLQEFLDTFRTKPVYFVLPSWRLTQFPAEAQSVLASSYVRYSGAVMVPGHAFEGADPGPHIIETVVSGVYRWWETDEARSVGLRVGDRMLGPGDTIFLERGEHRVELDGEGGGGMLAVRLEDPPMPGTEPFYGFAAVEEFVGLPPPWARALLGFP